MKSTCTSPRSCTIQILFVCLLPLIPLSSAKSQTLSDSLKSILEANSSAIFELSGLSFGGASTALISPSGNVTTAVSGTSIPGVDMTPENLLGASDFTQTLMAVLTFALAEEGALSLADPVGTYLSVDSLNNVPGNLTLEQLLSHTSGLFNFSDASDYKSTLLFDVTRAFSPGEITQLFVEGASSPGSFSYTNTGYLVLGMVLESANGSETLQESMDRLVLNPAGVQNMPIYQASDPENLAPLFDDVFGTGFPNQLTPHTSVFTGAGFAGNVSGTPSDMIRVMQALAAGELISENSLQQMLTFTAVNGRLADRYGLGVEEFSLEVGGEEKPYIGHSGGINYQTLVLYSLEDSVGVALSTNNALGSREALLETANQYFQAFDALEDDTVTSLVPVIPGEVPFSLFPNPVSDQLTVSFELSESAWVGMTLRDAAGREIQTMQVQQRAAGKYQEPISVVGNLPAGYYFLQISINGKPSARAFVKQ